MPILRSTCVLSLRIKFLEVELLGYSLSILNIFIKTVHLFFHLSKTEYCHSLKFLLSDGCMSYFLFSLHFLWLVGRLSALCISLSTVYLFGFFFFYWVVGFFIYRTSLYIIGINPLLATYIASIFPYKLQVSYKLQAGYKYCKHILQSLSTLFRVAIFFQSF